MGKERVPWTELQRAKGNYIRPKYLPEGVTLKQYYHLCQANVDAILKHWTWRQAAGKIPFCFRKAVKAIWQNKHTPEETNANIDTAPAEDAEKGPQDDNDSQE